MTDNQNPARQTRAMGITPVDNQPVETEESGD